MSTSLTTLYEIPITSATPGTLDLSEYTHRYDMTLVSVNSAATQTIILPPAATAVDKDITIAKLGAGRVAVTVKTTDYIASSSTGGSLYNDASGETFATVTVRPIPSANKWFILGAHGTWKV